MFQLLIANKVIMEEIVKSLATVSMLFHVIQFLDNVSVFLAGLDNVVIRVILFNYLHDQILFIFTHHLLMVS